MKTEIYIVCSIVCYIKIRLIPQISEVILDSIHDSRILPLKLIFILTFQNWNWCSKQPHSQIFTSQNTTSILYFPHSIYAPRSPSLDPNNTMHICKKRFIHYVTFANTPLKFQREKFRKQTTSIKPFLHKLNISGKTDPFMADYFPAHNEALRRKGF